MAGAYTHISIVRLLSVASRLEGIPGLHPSIIQYILDYPQFVELGSVAPDYPLLHLISSSSKAWSDRMHFEKTADPINSGLRRIKNMPENRRPPLIAWLLGYLSHYTVDLVIHPVIETKVGIYEKAKIAHRRLEMFHDAFVFSLLEYGSIEAAELIESGIKLCTTHTGNLDTNLATFWSDILSDVYPEAFRASPPQIDTWHRYYTGLVDDFAEEQ